MIIRAILLLSLLLIVTPSGARAAMEPLVRPTELEPAVTFWRRVYTEITTSEGFVHDDLKLDIVYETVRLSNANDRGRTSSASEAAGRYVRALRAIAAGKRDNLSAAEQRVMELWGPNIDKSAVSAAAERVRFQLGQANRFREGLIRSGAWEDYVKKTITEAGLPREIASLPHVESSFNPAARSKVGAAGMWQFMSSTGRRFMRIDNIVDERLDPYISTRAAALLMQQNYEVTGAWPLAITAYNHGAAGMRRAIEQVGSDDIALIVRKYKSRSFGFASRNFYAALLAAVDVDADPEHYFGPLDRHARDNSRVLVLPDYIAIGTLAKSLGVDTDALEGINLSLKPAVWNGTKRVPKGYELRIPHSAGDPQQLLASLPSDAWNSKQTPDLFHVVQRGETLSSIAPRYGARVSELVAINSLSSAARIRPGQKLILPAGLSKNTTEPVVDQGIYPAPAAPTSKPVVVAAKSTRAAPPQVAQVDVPQVAASQPASARNKFRRCDVPEIEVPQVDVPLANIEVPVLVAEEPDIVAEELPAAQPPQAGRSRGRATATAGRSQRLLGRRRSHDPCAGRRNDRSLRRLARRARERLASSQRHAGYVRGAGRQAAETRLLQIDARTVRERARCLSPGRPGVVLRQPSDRGDQRTRRETGRVDLGAGGAALQRAGMAAAPVQPRPRRGARAAVHSSRHSGSGEPGSVTAKRVALGLALVLVRRLCRGAVARQCAAADRVASLGNR